MEIKASKIAGLLKKYFSVQDGVLHSSRRVLKSVMGCASKGQYFEEFSRQETLNGHVVPSADTLQGWADCAAPQAGHAFEKILDKIMPRTRSPVVLALDGHDKPYYGERDLQYITGSKPKQGTAYFEHWETIEIVTGAPKLALGLHLRRALEQQTDIVEELVRKARERVEIGLLMLDRGYFSSEIMTLLDGLKVRWLMPAVRNPKLKQSVLEHYLKGEFVFDYEMNAGYGFRIFFFREDDDFVVFATSMRNVSESEVWFYAELYRKRWNIETGYRDKNGFLIPTRSRKEGFRILRFVLSCLLYNLWVFFRNEAWQPERFTKDVFMHMVKHPVSSRRTMTMMAS